ncbi:Alpha-D-glucose-1-phosphate phosphatase YihX [compost metagenome]
MKKRDIRAILFDSGKVLNEPSTGNWFIPPRFFAIVDKEKYRAIDKKRIGGAFRHAQAYISKQSWVRDEQEEFEHFLMFYRIFSDALPQLNLSGESISLLAADMVYNYSKYRFFGDALELIPVLSKTHQLAVVSDAWPSLHSVYREAGLRRHFSSFVISTEIGVTKPHELMYKKALEELAMQPEEAVFVDDNPVNCEGARKAGIQSILLCRDWRMFWYYTFKNRSFPAVRNLKGIVNYIQ